MESVAVYGATGHTGRFVVAELLERGFAPLLAGRDPDRLGALAAAIPGTVARPAAVEDPAALDRALAGAAAVVHCAGPFATTGSPVVEAALRAGIPYVDVAAEIEAIASTFAEHVDARTLVVPAMAFYGGLGDLLVTAALGDRVAADEVDVAYGLGSWHPTPGTRTAGAVSHRRRAGRRVRFTGGTLQYHDDAPREQDWTFPEPMGPRRVIAEFTMADVVTVPSHLAVPEVRTYMTVEAARDLARADTPAPEPAVRSDQSYAVDVLVRAGQEERRATACGRDIYATSASLVVEAVARILTGRTRATGVVSAGTAFDAADVLRALAPHVAVELPGPLPTGPG